MWYDYDEDCNGPKEQHEGDYQYAAGFTWDCCGKSGAWDGCRQGRHKDEDDSDSDSEDDDEAEEKNVVVPPPVVAVSRVSPGKKRIAEEPLEQALEHHKVLKIATQAPEQSENPSIAEPSSMSQREQHVSLMVFEMNFILSVLSSSWLLLHCGCRPRMLSLG